jgi:2-keto-4-pentenoate hydratase/2-oxohepta-3-ene-1,7-dioic acid hydratase in catechol pathway
MAAARNFKDFHLFGKKIVAIGRNYAEHAKEVFICDCLKRMKAACGTEAEPIG